MRVERIRVDQDSIRISCTEWAGGALSGRAFAPLVQGSTGRKTPSRTVCETDCVADGCLVFPRYAGDYDLLICRFEVYLDGVPLDGVRYVTDFALDFSKGDRDIPPKGKPVGTWVTCPGEDMDFYGFGGMMTEINSTWIQTLTP